MGDRIHRILIVDDDQDICANLSDILADAGYQTEVAPDGDIAISKFHQTPSGQPGGFDLCLLDFKMPGMDGVELLTRLQDLAPSLRAIMITAYAGEDGIQRAVEAGTSCVLKKPVDIGELLGTIRQVVSEAG